MRLHQVVSYALLVVSSVVVASSCSGEKGAADEASGGGGSEEGGSGGGASQAGNGGGVGSGGSAGSGSGGNTPASGGASAGGTNAGGKGGAAPAATGGMTGTGGTPGSVAMYKPAKFSNNFDGADTVVGQKPPSPFLGGPAVIDDSKKYSGTKSVKVPCSGAGGGDQCMFNLPLDAQWLGPNRKTLYTRFMVNIDDFPATEGRVHWDILKVKGDFKSDDGKITIYNGFISLGGFGNRTTKFMVFGANAGGSPAEDCSKSADELITPKQWHCVELQIDAEEIITYAVNLNSKSLQAFNFPYTNAAANCANIPPYIADVFKGVWYVPVMKTLSFGFNSVSNGGAVKAPTVWIDDIAVSDSPIGCPAK